MQKFLSVAQVTVKEILPIVDKPIIHFIVEEAIQSRIADIIMKWEAKCSIENYFDENVYLEQIHFYQKQDELLILVY